MKQCKKCKKEYPEDQFRLESYGRRNKCRLCRNEETRILRNKRYQKYPEKHEAYKLYCKQKRKEKLLVKKDYDRERYLKHRDKMLKQRRENYWNDPAAHRKKRMMMTYKISSEKYDKLNNTYFCECCGRHKDEFKKGLAIDHCHETNKVRGMLCSNCNSGIGFFKDNPNFMMNAIHYINKHK